jgi:hypothetical protein
MNTIGSIEVIDPAFSQLLAPGAAIWDRAVLANPPLTRLGHPRVLFNNENLNEIRHLAETNPDSAAAESSQSAGKSSARFGKGSATDDSSAAANNSSEAGATGTITTWLDIQSADLKQFVRRLREAEIGRAHV